MTAMASFQIKKGWSERLRHNQLDTLEALLARPLEDPQANPSGAGESGTVILNDETRLLLKRSYRPSFVSACRDLWRCRCLHSEPVWEVILFDQLLTLGFQVPTCIAHGENRLFRFAPAGAVLLQLPPGQPLDAFLRETAGENDRREAILQAEKTLRSLQFNRVLWDDCQPRHFQVMHENNRIALTCMEGARMQDTPLDESTCQRQYEYFYANL